MMMRLAVLALAGLSAIASASTGFDGTWYMERTSGTGPDVGAAVYARAASAQSSLYVVNSMSPAAGGTFYYDHPRHVWQKIGGLPESSAVIAPDLAYAQSGVLISFGGAGTGSTYLNNMHVLLPSRYSGTQLGWISIPMVARPEARLGHSLTLFNGVLYVLFGFSETKFYTSIWAYDLNQLMTSTASTPSNWTQVTPDGAAGLPPARMLAAVNVYEERIYAFGGRSHNPSVSDPKCSLGQDNCVYYNDVWMWTPAPGTPTAGQGGAWVQVSLETPQKPAARHSPASAFMEDNRMFIFGGSGAKEVALSDTWLFIERGPSGKGEWIELAPVGNLPPAMGAPLGGRVGRVFLVFPNDPSTTPVVYKYDPYDLFANVAASPSPSAAPTPQTCIADTDWKGATAGLVLILLCSIGAVGFSGFVFWKHIK